MLHARPSATTPSKAEAFVSDKREAIIEVACALFASQGYEQTTIAQIAHQAGVAVGTVYLFFPTKHALLVQVSRTVQARLATALQYSGQETLPLPHLIRGTIERLFRVCRQHQELLGLAVMEAPSSEEARQGPLLVQQLTVIFQAGLQEAMTQGSLFPSRQLWRPGCLPYSSGESRNTASVPGRAAGGRLSCGSSGDL